MPIRSKTQGAFRFATPAKITPVLRVLARRSDGYHDVRLALVAVSLQDAIAWEPGGTELALQVQSAEPLGPWRENLVYRAALAFQGAAGVTLRGRLRLTKRVPTGAGLGGGSANAAGTLVALNLQHGSPLSEHRLWELAQSLGSDVPFFLNPRPQWAEGRGERLSPIPGFPRLPVLVVKPPFAISTAQAYGQVRPRPDPATGAPALPRLDSLEAVAAALVNDFEPALLPAYPALGAIKARLLAAGARGALLSGSGSAVFGLFDDDAGRDCAAQVLAGEEPAWTVLSCATLPGHAYTPTSEIAP